MECCKMGDHKCNISIDIPDHAKHYYTRGVNADKCLVPHIKKLFKLGYYPVHSCCGHGKLKPHIWIEIDEAELEINP